MSDALSITESKDYTFEESEDDIGTQGTPHIDISKDKVDHIIETDSKTRHPPGNSYLMIDLFPYFIFKLILKEVEWGCKYYDIEKSYS